MDKIKSMEYTELWYFTTEGIMDGSKITPTAADDTFGLLPTHGGLALQQIKASRASHNVIGNKALTWDQITTARHHFITAAAGWPDKHRMAMAEFFMNLESLKASGSCPCTLIAYQATARRHWHATLKGIGQPFNISNISKPLLLTLENRVRDHDHRELKQAQSRDRKKLKQAHTFPLNLHGPHTNSPFLPLPYLPFLLPPFRCAALHTSPSGPPSPSSPRPSQPAPPSPHTSPSQMAAQLCKGMTDSRASEWDRSRSRRRDRGQGQIRSSR